MDDEKKQTTSTQDETPQDEGAEAAGPVADADARRRLGESPPIVATRGRGR